VLDRALIFLRDHLNAVFRARAAAGVDAESEDIVVFLGGDSLEPVNFPNGKVSLLLMNIEQESAMRPADPFHRVGPDGHKRPVQPQISVNLYVLFVARFSKYEASLAELSVILHHFQSHRSFDSTDNPRLSPVIHKLMMEFVSQSFNQQNEVWNALRVSYHPSLLYRVKMLTYRDDALTLDQPEIDEIELDAEQRE
jgi:hypothetical protein